MLIHGFFEFSRCVAVFYQQIENSDIANQIHGFTIDYGKFILKLDRNTEYMFSISFRKHREEKKENNLVNSDYQNVNSLC